MVGWCSMGTFNDPCFSHPLGDDHLFHCCLWWADHLAAMVRSFVGDLDEETGHISPFLFWGDPYFGKTPNMKQYGYGSIPMNTMFRGMNIHLPAILGFTRGTRVLTHPHMKPCWYACWYMLMSHDTQDPDPPSLHLKICNWTCFQLQGRSYRTPNRLRWWQHTTCVWYECPIHPRVSCLSHPIRHGHVAMMCWVRSWFSAHNLPILGPDWDVGLCTSAASIMTL